MQWSFKLAVGIFFFFGPLIASAASVSINGLYPTDGVAGTGTRVSFAVLRSGFSLPVTYYLVDSFAGGANTGNLDSSGSFIWTPNKDDIGTHTMTVTVSDSSGATASAAVTISVVQPSVSLSDVTPVSVQYGVPVSFTISSSGFVAPSYWVADSFPYSSVSSSKLFGTVFSWTPLLQDSGVHTLVVYAEDGFGRVASTTKSVTVFGLPRLVVSGILPGGSIGVGQTLQLVATTTGLVSPTITFTDLFSNTAPSSFKQEGSQVTWTPVYNDVGVHTIRVTALDANARSASQDVQVVVVPGQGSTAAYHSASTPGVTDAPKANGYLFTSYLALGSSGPAVTELQKKLYALGYLKTAPTGFFGPLTKKALQDFQKAKGLEPVGFVGPGTRKALNAQ